MSKNRAEIIKQRDFLIEQITKYCPVIEQFFELDMKLRDYHGFLYKFQIDPIHQQRQELVKDNIRAKLSTLFGADYATKFQVNLDGKLACNIADHHQVINHPFLASANIIGNTRRLLQPQKQDAIIVLSSGDVPPNNYFSKNGFMLHGKRVPLFSNAEREKSSYYIPRRDFNMTERLQTSDRWNDFSAEEQAFLTAEEERMRSFDYSQCRDYCDQITVIVKNTWPRLFETKLRETLPELLYVTQEEITTQCLITLLEEDTMISRCLFDPDFREAVLDNFRGNVVTWQESDQRGTHFFWRKYPGRSQSLRMYVDGDTLRPADQRFTDLTISLEKDEIIRLLRAREIYPSLFMIFGVLHFYAGVKPLVGYGSVMYLHLMKQAWLKTLSQFGMDEEARLVTEVETNGFTAGLALFFQKVNNDLRTLYAYDIFYEGGMSEEYLKKILDMKFGEILSVGVADMYDYYSQKYIPVAERIQPAINFDDLSHLAFDWI